MKSKPIPTHTLELRLRELGQLFNSMDPTPFLNKDLDPEAEAYIESWALGFPSASKLHLTIHLEKNSEQSNPGTLLTAAIHNHFHYKSGLVRRDLKELFRQGRISLFIGFAFVVVCLIAADTISKVGSSTAFTIARESLTIVGWVAMWKPLQIFLYDWWPLVRRIRSYEALTNAQIRVIDAIDPASDYSGSAQALRRGK